MMRWPLPSGLLATLAVGSFITPACAFACSIDPNYTAAFADKVAETGYLVEARVIRGYDARTRTPEMLLVDRIFVGEGMPRQMVLLRDESFFETRANGIGDTCSVEFAAAEEKPRFFVLFRGSSGKVGSGDERWIMPMLGSGVGGEGLKRILDKAARKGRLRGRPRVLD